MTLLLQTLRKTFLGLLFIYSGFLQAEKPLKVLHLCFHEGCLNEIQGIAEICNVELTSWNIHTLPPFFFDPKTKGGNNLYNIDHKRARRVWNKHKDFFRQFDAIITSDTTALSRIFLQNKWEKPLIVWVTMQFDWNFGGDTTHNLFPDEEFYTLLSEAKKRSNVFIVPVNEYQVFYAKQKKVDLGNRFIAPCAYHLSAYINQQPQDCIKNTQLFIHSRTEDVQAHHNHDFVISKVLQKLNIPVACYRYPFNELATLAGYKGVLYLPYQWSVLSFFETLRLGLPTFVPSESFLVKMIKENSYFFEQSEYLTRDHLFPLTVWYHPSVKEIVIYFDSWEDLKQKIAELDYKSIHEKTLAYGKAHTNEMGRRWKDLFEEIRQQVKAPAKIGISN